MSERDASEWLRKRQRYFWCIVRVPLLGIEDRYLVVWPSPLETLL